MTTRLRELGKAVECCIYPDEAHVFNAPDAIIDSTRRIECFLDERL